MPASETLEVIEVKAEARTAEVVGMISPAAFE